MIRRDFVVGPSTNSLSLNEAASLLYWIMVPAAIWTRLLEYGLYSHSPSVICTPEGSGQKYVSKTECHSWLCSGNLYFSGNVLPSGFSQSSHVNRARIQILLAECEVCTGIMSARQVQVLYGWSGSTDLAALLPKSVFANLRSLHEMTRSSSTKAHTQPFSLAKDVTLQNGRVARQQPIHLRKCQHMPCLYETRLREVNVISQ